jgi:hypothetical protein
LIPACSFAGSLIRTGFESARKIQQRLVDKINTDAVAAEPDWRQDNRRPVRTAAPPTTTEGTREAPAPSTGAISPAILRPTATASDQPAERSLPIWPPPRLRLRPTSSPSLTSNDPMSVAGMRLTWPDGLIEPVELISRYSNRSDLQKRLEETHNRVTRKQVQDQELSKEAVGRQSADAQGKARMRPAGRFAPPSKQR